MRLKDTLTTWHLAWPIAVGQLASTGTAFIDAVMAGHVSAGDLAAVSVGSSIWVTLIVTLMGYLLATSPLVAHKLGAGETATIPGLTQQALAQALILSLFALGITRLIAPVFVHLGLEPEIAQKAGDFLRAVSFGLPAFACYRVLYSYSAALHQTKPMMVMSVLCLLLNIPTNWILIYGHFGFPAMGGVGCGWATAFCVTVNFVLLAGWILRTRAYHDTHPFRAWQGWDGAMQKQLIKLGLPIGVMFLVEVSAFSLIALIIARLGTAAVAAHQIALNFSHWYGTDGPGGACRWCQGLSAGQVDRQERYPARSVDRCELGRPDDFRRALGRKLVHPGQRRAAGGRTADCAGRNLSVFRYYPGGQCRCIARL